MSRIWLPAACAALIAASGCVPTSRYVQMRNMYEEEAAKSRGLAEDNARLESQIDQFRYKLKSGETDREALEKILRASKGKWPVIPGTTRLGDTGLVLGQLTFRPGKADLSPQGKAILDKVADHLKKFAEVKVVVDGHTDKDPIRHSRHRSNWELSGKRAAAVADYLVETGAVKGQNAMLRGFSKFRPIDPENKTKNRRVEVRYIPIGKGGQPAGGGAARSEK